MSKNILSVLIIAAGIAASPSLAWAQAGGGAGGGAGAAGGTSGVGGPGGNAGTPVTPGTPGSPGNQGVVGAGGANGTTTNPAMLNHPTVNEQSNTTGGAPAALPPSCTRAPVMVNGVQRCN